MRYVRLEIQHFKGISRLELDLNKKPRHPVFTLVGLNESGKTTILEAIHWFYDQSDYDDHDLIPKRSRANFNDKVAVTAQISLSEADRAEIEKLFDEYSLVPNELPTTISITRARSYRASKVTDKIERWTFGVSARKKKGKKERPLQHYPEAWRGILKHIRTQMFPPVIYYENFLFDVPDKIYLHRESGKLTSTESRYRDVIQDVLNALKMNLDIQTHLVERHRSGTETDRQNIRAVLDEASAHITDVVISAWRDIVRMGDRDLSITLGDSLAEDEKGLYLEIRVKEGRQTFYIRERSLGFRWFFGFVLFTHFRTFRDNQREHALFLLDEPASNLHPAAQTKLLDAFATLPNKQVVVYSTHSHHMIRPDWLGNAFIVKNVAMDYHTLGLGYRADQTEIDSERYYVYVSQNPQDTDLFRPVLDALDYRPSLLDMVPDLVIVEGKNDYYSLRLAIREVMGGDPPWKVYPSTGKDKTDYVASLYLGWGRNFIVLLDGDGEQTKRRLNKSYGPIASSRVFTLGDVSPTWRTWTMERLFDSRDQKKLVGAEFPGTSVSKSRLNTAIQAAWLGGQTVELNRYTQDRFTKLFAFCAERIRLGAALAV